MLASCCGEYEIVLVNDGSRDASWEVIAGLADGHGSVRGINLMRDYGQHNALLCGIRMARHTWDFTGGAGFYWSLLKTDGQ